MHTAVQQLERQASRVLSEKEVWCSHVYFKHSCGESLHSMSIDFGLMQELETKILEMRKGISQDLAHLSLYATKVEESSGSKGFLTRDH